MLKSVKRHEIRLRTHSEVCSRRDETLYILKCDQERDPIDIWMPSEGHMCELINQLIRPEQIHLLKTADRYSPRSFLNMLGRRRD
jgi:hypothetical protein